MAEPVTSSVPTLASAPMPDFASMVPPEAASKMADTLRMPDQQQSQAAAPQPVPDASVSAAAATPPAPTAKPQTEEEKAADAKRAADLKAAEDKKKADQQAAVAPVAPAAAKAPTGDTAAVAAPSAGGSNGAQQPEESAGRGGGGGGGGAKSAEEELTLLLLSALLGVDLGGGGGGLGGGGGVGGGHGGSSAGRSPGWGRAALQAGEVCKGKVTPVTMANKSSTAAETVLALARAEVGVHEVGDNGGKDVARYNQATGQGTGTPWCASFTSYIYQKAGVEGIGSAMALGVGGQFRESFHRFGDSSYAQKPGDVIVFSRGGGKGHVGIIEDVTKDKNGETLIHTIEGNASDQVKRNTYRLSDLKAGSHGAVGVGSLDQLVEKNAHNKERFLARGEKPEVAQQHTPRDESKVVGKDEVLKRS